MNNKPLNTKSLIKSEKGGRVESIYFLKAISCFFVVAVHSSVYGSEIFSSLFGIGTLCFLTITGYLLYSENQSRVLQKCTKWARKLFKLSIIVTTVYLIELILLCTFFSCRDSGITYYSALVRESINVTDTQGEWLQYIIVWSKNIVASLLFGSRVCTTLWYLTAVWEGLLILHVIFRYTPKLLYILPLLFVIVYFLRSHPSLLFPDAPHIATYMRLSVLTALPLLSTGYLIHKHEELLQRIVKVHIWLPVVLIMLLIETQIRIHIFGSYGRYCFFTYPLVVLLIVACKKYSNFTLPFFNTIGEKHSANIYYFHMIILFLLMAFKIHIPYVEAVVVWLLCIPLSILFNNLSDSFHCLRYHNKTIRHRE